MISLWLSEKLFLHGIEIASFVGHPKGLFCPRGLMWMVMWMGFWSFGIGWLKHKFAIKFVNFNEENADFTWLFLMDQQQTGLLDIYNWRGWENPIYVSSNLTKTSSKNAGWDHECESQDNLRLQKAVLGNWDKLSGWPQTWYLSGISVWRDARKQQLTTNMIGKQ